MSLSPVQTDFTNQIKLSPNSLPLRQSISSIAWCPTQSYLFAITTWDGWLRLFQITPFNSENGLVQKMQYQFDKITLRCCWNNQNNHIYVGMIDGTVMMLDMVTGSLFEIGKHNFPISSLLYLPDQRALLSTAYENIVHVWQQGVNGSTSTFKTVEKIYNSESKASTILFNLANEKIHVQDLKFTKSETLLDSIELGKGSQLQSLTMNIHNSYVAFGSFDGRVNISNLQKNYNSQHNLKSVITFKSHKHEQNGINTLFPVNVVGFHPTCDKWLMTGGSDGFLHFWNYELKNKIKSFNFGGIPVCAAKINPQGDMLAYGLGNDWHIGEQGRKWPSLLQVHRFGPDELSKKKY